jgi:bifunctional enzyme CysN/CysC
LKLRNVATGQESLLKVDGVFVAIGHAPAVELFAGKLKQKASKITLDEREKRLGQKGATVLLYGLTGSGKAQIAFELEKRLFDAGRAVTVLYGPDMRQGLCRDLGFTADERSENLRRSAEVARLLNDSGLLCICAFVAPHDAVREKARRVVGGDRFLSVYLSSPVEVCRQRDKTGGYELADAGKLTQFPGVSADYEPPANPDLVLPTHEITVEQSVDRILAMLKERRFVS